MTRRLSLLALSSGLALAVFVQGSAAQQPQAPAATRPAPVRSPEVHPDVVAATGVDGAAVFGRSCAGCHGGDGSGGIGPRLAGGRIVVAFPDAEDQIAVVTDGRGGMPAFGERLTPDEIAAVVEYTRTVLAEVNP